MTLISRVEKKEYWLYSESRCYELRGASCKLLELTCIDAL